MPAGIITDTTFTTILSLTPFYRKGWGDPGVVTAVRDAFLESGAPTTIEPRWHRERVERGAIVREGYFPTPVGLPMPPEVRTAWFLMMLPPHDPANPPPVCIHLAATSDQGYGHRKRLARILLRKGIGSVILENPYYGKRSPKSQFGVALHHLSDQLLMNLATIEEARGLATWLTRRGHPAIGVTGYSMGGFMSAFTAALYPDPIAAIPCAAGTSPGFIFTQTAMSRVPDWDALGESVDDPRDAFSLILDELRVDRLPVPREPESAIIVAARSDAIVPPQQAIKLHRYWKGSRLRWIEASHITGFMFHLGEVADAIRDALAIRLVRHEAVEADDSPSVAQ